MPNILNAEAGDVPVPEDPRELAAVQAAVRTTYRVFPYYEYRFGGRGRRFGASDGGWLVWLVRLPQKTLEGTVVWLQQVLGARGMPGWLLEVHLDILVWHLNRVRPDGRDDYARLTKAVTSLREDRTAVISDEGMNVMAREFAASLTSDPSRTVVGLGRLVVAAVVDERLGMVRVVDSFREWLDDVDTLRGLALPKGALSPAEQDLLHSDAFPERWEAAIDTLVMRARRWSEA